MIMWGIARQLVRTTSRRSALQQPCTSKVVKRYVSARLELPQDVAGTRTKVVRIPKKKNKFYQNSKQARNGSVLIDSVVLFHVGQDKEKGYSD